jgi:hypothetical protein
MVRAPWAIQTLSEESLQMSLVTPLGDFQIVVGFNAKYVASEEGQN